MQDGQGWKPSDPNDHKAWQLLEKVVMAGTVEHRRTRRWGIFFKMLTFAYLFGALFLFSPFSKFEKAATTEEHVAVINLRGPIMDQEQASADSLIGSLREAFDDKNTRAVIMRINSPGGSPVQSGYVYDEIKRLRALHPDIKLYAVITDMGASGAYYIASAADAIYADKASLVGSIGVTAAGFGFVDSMKLVGVERRLYTSGEHKAFLDPFSPQRAEETEFWKTVLETTHRQFVDSVKKGRGDRLKADEHPELFSGLVWSGEQALQLGLVDALGSTSYVAREVVKVDNLVDFTAKESPLDRFAKKVGIGASTQVMLWLGLDGPQLR